MVLVFLVLALIHSTSTLETDNKSNPPPPTRPQTLKILSPSGTPLSPLSSSPLQCGSSPSIKIWNNQILYLQLDRPFIATISTSQKYIRVSALAYSEPQENGRHLALVILDVSCDGYFSYVRFQMQVQVDVLDGELVGIVGGIGRNVSVNAYCEGISEMQLISIQETFDIGYTILTTIIISLLPTYPINSGPLQVVVVVLLTISQYTLMSRSALLMLSCSLISRYCFKLKQNQLEPQEQRSLKLFKTSFATGFLFFIIACFIKGIFVDGADVGNGGIGLFLIGVLYFSNFCVGVLLAQILGSVVWVGRVRGVVWFGLGVGVGYYLWAKYGYLLNIPPSMFSLLTPSIFSENCKYQSLMPILLLNPPCLYLQKFLQIKFLRLLILVLASILSFYSIKVALIFCFWLLLLWLVKVIRTQGYFRLFARRDFLPNAQVRAI